MKSISDFAVSLYLFIYKFYLNMILKVRRKISSAIFLNAYIKANSLFPDATLNENRQLAHFVRLDILGIPHKIKNKEEKNESAKELRDIILSDQKIKDTIANYFLITEFYFSFGNKDEHNKQRKENADEALSKAKSYKDTAEPISTADIKDINKKTRKEIKKLKRIMRRINSTRIEEEKEKIITPIKITPSVVIIFMSILSSLFLVGGFLYTKILLGFLDINTSDFFDTSDYISSSVDIIFPILLSVFLGMFFYFDGALYSLSKIVAAEQFDNEPKQKNIFFHIVVFICAADFFITLFLEDVFMPLMLFLPILYCLDYILLNFLKIDKYIENSFTFRSILFSFLIFLTYLGIEIADTVYQVKNGEYKNPYTVSFTEDYKEYSDHAFFMANSEYVFLLDKETKKLSVLPKTSIKAIHTNQ